jgi:hypothetical protein
MNVAMWSAAPQSPDVVRTEGHLWCLACDGPVERSLAALGSLRCLACREADAPLDAALVGARRGQSPFSGGDGSEEEERIGLRG